jgi:hypothetical protein
MFKGTGNLARHGGFRSLQGQEDPSIPDRTREGKRVNVMRLTWSRCSIH